VAPVSYVLLVNTACGLFPFLHWDIASLCFLPRWQPIAKDCATKADVQFVAENVYKLYFDVKMVLYGVIVNFLPWQSVRA
jgi:hypothetical protein